MRSNKRIEHFGVRGAKPRARRRSNLGFQMVK
jgi:hypothetical protein